MPLGALIREFLYEGGKVLRLQKRGEWLAGSLRATYFGCKGTYKVGLGGLGELLFGGISNRRVWKGTQSASQLLIDQAPARTRRVGEQKSRASDCLPGANELARTVLMSGAFPSMIAVYGSRSRKLGGPDTDVEGEKVR